MLGKLIRLEFRVTSKVLIPLHLFVIAITVIGFLLLQSRILQSKAMAPAAFLLTGIYIFTLFVICTSVIIYLAVRFYRNFYTKQGYLMFTLPVSTWNLLHAKSIVAFVWYVIDYVIIYSSSFLLFYTSGGYQSLYDELRKDAAFYSLVESFEHQFNLLLVIFCLASTFCSITAISFSIVVGQLFKKYRAIMATIIYFVTYTILQVISLTSSFPAILNILPASGEMNDFYAVMPDIYRIFFIYWIIINLIIGIALYIATGILMKKKLNLT